MKNTSQARRIIRHKRVRARVHGTASCPRVSVFRSSKHMQVQIIDDESGKTLFGMTDAVLKTKEAKSGRARLLGEAVASRAQELGIGKIVFDRGGYRYHGRVKALADAVRSKGIKF